MSQWKDFADNFSTFYKIGNQVQSNMAIRDIMDEEIEEVKGAEIDPDLTTEWNYGGLSYNKEITPYELSALKNNRIADVYTRFGNTTKAKEMAELIAKQQSTKFEAEKHTPQLESLQAKRDTDVMTFNEFSSPNAQLSREKVIDNALLQEDLNKEKITLQQKQAEFDNLVFDSGYEKNLAIRLSQINTDWSNQQVLEEAARLNLEGNKTLSLFAKEMGEGGVLHHSNFEDASAHAIAQQKWLTENWRGEAAIRDLISKIGADDLSRITNEGSRITAEVNNAISNKSPAAAQKALIKVIDMQDGIPGNMEFGYDEKDNLILYEAGEPVVTGVGDDWSKFVEKLHVQFTPLAALDIAKKNAEIAYSIAQTEDLKGKAQREINAANALAWDKHTETDLYRQLLLLDDVKFKQQTGFDTLDEYQSDFMARRAKLRGLSNEGGTTNTKFPGFSSEETTTTTEEVPTEFSEADTTSGISTPVKAKWQNRITSTYGTSKGNAKASGLSKKITEARKVMSSTKRERGGDTKIKEARAFLANFKNTETTQKYIEKLQAELKVVKAEEIPKNSRQSVRMKKLANIEDLEKQIKEAEKYKRGISAGSGGP